MKRIIWHWTAGAHSPNAVDREAYHFLIDGAGKIHAGDHVPEDNLDCTDDRYAAHTGGANTGAIGIALCAMAGASDKPFRIGRYPVTLAQVDALVALSGRLCREYGIPVHLDTVLSHAEVQPTLKIPQAGKWDIRWLPGMEHKLHDAVTIGNHLRARVRAWMQDVPDGVAFRPRPWTARLWAAAREWMG